jgi:heme a synthase
MTEQALVDLAPLARLMLLALVLALFPLAWVWLRRPVGPTGIGAGAQLQARLATLTAITLFLTFDLIVFGAFTRLTDSGLGCPDWPGCYGEVSPWGAKSDIQAAQHVAPGGPVTWGKAWIEMIHRYLAMTVGVLILVMTAVAWRARRGLPFSPWWPTLTLVWVLIQGGFGKYTVTLKLYPAVVSLHLLGGLFLLVLLATQHVAFRPVLPGQALLVSRPVRRLAWAAAAVLFVQIALGAWVSTNYAVLACTGFPACNGQWWPEMDFDHGFTLLRGLGEGVDGRGLTLPALVAIHMAHRLFALVVVLVLGVLAWLLARGPGRQRRVGAVLGTLVALQVLSGLSNVVLGWPLMAALGHSAGAAGLVLTLALLLARSHLEQAAAMRPSAQLGQPGTRVAPAS